MNRKLVLALGFVFLVSAGINVYWYIELQRYEEALVEQIVATSEIEAILKESEADTSFEGIKRLAIATFGSDSVSEVDVPEIQITWGADRIGLKVNETLLLFRNGVYYGSKANLPLH
ncbi:hypothetical protein ACJO2E_18685 [Marinobacter sp. M1N3S26]|uniref:hypothetical protein n=1 Tax=Marinobacter sp. M1N3S26 TaxID=3382299 RepID=UPI00387AEA04